jgi:hypothetical protein
MVRLSKSLDYVREHSRREHEESPTSTTAWNEGVEQENDVAQDALATLGRLPTDIQAILDALRRRQENCVPGKHRIVRMKKKCVVWQT